MSQEAYHTLFTSILTCVKVITFVTSYFMTSSYFNIEDSTEESKCQHHKLSYYQFMRCHQFCDIITISDDIKIWKGITFCDINNVNGQ